MNTEKNISRTNLFKELAKRPSLLSYLEGMGNLAELFSMLPRLSLERRELFQDMYVGIGNTPIHVLPLGNGNRLHIKLECHNSMGNNHYSRYWLIHLALAEAFGIIVPNVSKIIEVTSGSSGISLSLACQQLGYQLTMIVPGSLPKGRTDPMQNAGATLIRVPGYIDACIAKLKEMLLQDNYYAANHSEEKSNLITHVFSRIAIEYSLQYGIPDVAILGLGNGSSTEAVAKWFKHEKRETNIYAYYPSFDSKQIVLGLYGPNVELQHISKAKDLIDVILYTSEVEIGEVSNECKQDEIISTLGVSSLYAITFAKKLAEITNGFTYFSIGYDKMDRYL